VPEDKIEKLMERKVKLSGQLRDLDDAQFDADGPDPSDENDSEDQTLLRVALYEIDEQLEKEGVFDA
jgi:hypothetical protein